MVLVDIDDKLKERMEKYVDGHRMDFPTMKFFTERAIRKELDKLEKE